MYENLELNSMVVDMKRDTTLVWRDINFNSIRKELNLYVGNTYTDGKGPSILIFKSV
jgi:hypothetical protein